MQPFDKKKAAEFYVVAWVKDWNVRTYLTAIGCKDINFDDIHDLYNFMPAQKHYYVVNSRIKPLTSIYMRSINDKLYDAKDTKQLLKLALEIEKFISDKEIKNISHQKDVAEIRKENKRYQALGLGHKLSVETMRRGTNHHWNVCK